MKVTPGLRAILTLAVIMLWVIAAALVIVILDAPQVYIPADHQVDSVPTYGPQPDGTYRLTPEQLRGRCETCPRGWETD